MWQRKCRRNCKAPLLEPSREVTAMRQCLEEDSAHPQSWRMSRAHSRLCLFLALSNFEKSSPGPPIVKEVIFRGFLQRFPQSKSNSHFFITHSLFFFSSISLVPLTKFLICAQLTLKHIMSLDLPCLLLQFCFLKLDSL